MFKIPSWAMATLSRGVSQMILLLSDEGNEHDEKKFKWVLLPKSLSSYNLCILFFMVNL